MEKEPIGVQVMRAFPGLKSFTNFDYLDEWREGRKTRFTRHGSEDSSLGGSTSRFKPVAIVRNGELEQVKLESGDIGGGILISNSDHMTQGHIVGDMENPGITLEEFLKRYENVEAVVFSLEDRDTNRREWDEEHIEIVRIS